MRPISVVTLLLLFSLYSSTATASTTFDKVTLKPGESKSFSLDAQAKMKIGFKPLLSSAEAKNCKNNCIKFSQTGGTSMASMFGGTIGMEPKDGKIEGVVENVETFAIEVELYHK